MYGPNDSHRLVDEQARERLPKEKYRTQWRRDAGRVLHSPAFRRLQGKTQLFPTVESDFFRNRLTHSLEVGQIAKSIAISLNNRFEFLQQPGFAIEPDICEVAGWCHDLGYPPFGHTGEDALDEEMRQWGGFEGNAQTLRILAKTEKKITQHPNTFCPVEKGKDLRAGLNLTYRVLASVLKYDNRIPMRRDKHDKLQKGYYEEEADLVRKIKEAVAGDPECNDFKTVECQIMDVADDIAYSTYDVEDAFKAGFLTPLDMVSADEAILVRVAERISISRGETVSAMWVQQGLEKIFSDFTGSKAASTVAKASRYVAQDGYIRCEFSSGTVGVCDFIAGMTDRYAVEYYGRLFSESPMSIFKPV